MKQREVQDSENTRWQCVETYSSMTGSDEATVARPDDDVEVVCTPSGGAQTVRISLRSGWNETMSDEDLLKEIEDHR